MKKEIVVNVGRRETRVAMLEDGQLAELKIEREKDVLGNIYKGKVENVVSGLDAAFADCGLDRNVFLHVSDAVLEEPSKKMLRHKMDAFPPIEEVVQRGQEILMQVTKGPVGSKGPRGTRRISLPGRYLVLMVQGGGKVGVSRKIADEKERDRLREMGEKVRPEGMGIIIRTRAEGVGQAELRRDISFLTRLWASIQRRAKRTPSPALIHEDLSLVFEVIRDVFSTDVDRFVIDDPDTHHKVMSLVGSIAPHLRKRVELYEGQQPLFSKYDIEKQIERALRPRVWLPKGGHIKIEHTEALTTIDVNSGKFTGGGSLADTVLQSNLHAVEEIVRQIRVRDIGGIIVIDFIDMENPDHRRKVMSKLKEALKADRVRTRVVHLTPLGLVEMTRKRTGDPLSVQLQSVCPCCEGRGRVASVETAAARIEERLRELSADGGDGTYRVTCNPLVCLHLIGEAGTEVDVLEEELGLVLHVRCAPEMHPERFVIKAGAPDGLNDDGLPFRDGEVITIEPEQALDIPSEGLMAVVNGSIVHVPDAPHVIDQTLSVRLAEVDRSYLRGTVAKRKSRRSRKRGGRRRSRKKKTETTTSEKTAEEKAES
jgi:ribonuclease G